jgi:hypothetical protein
MTHDLDAKGLEAAALVGARVLRDTIGWDNQAARAKAVYQAMADAAQPEGEADRIAVVVSAPKDGDRAYNSRLLLDPDTKLTEEDWRDLEGWVDECWGPLARAIVEVKLPRPAEPAVVAGRVVE